MRRVVLLWLIGGLWIFESTILWASSSRYMKLASQWAPILFHDEAGEFVDPTSGFSPIDSPVGFFFDQNEDLRDNGMTIFRLSAQREGEVVREVPIYFSVIESRTHFYLNYVVYHAVDAKAVGVGHTHDTENILVIVEKSEATEGELVGVVTNAHGFGMAYSKDADRQRRWRSQLGGFQERSFLEAMDRAAREQDQGERLESVERANSVSPMLFVAQRSHAIYKFNSFYWDQPQSFGSVYLPSACSECLSIARMPARQIVMYELVSLDEVIWGGADRGEDFWSVAQSRPRVTERYQEKIIPGFLSPSERESDAKVNLFYRATFKTGIPLSDPARFHRHLEGGSSAISVQYLFNPFLERRTPSVLTGGTRGRRQKSILLLLADQFLDRLN